MDEYIGREALQAALVRKRCGIANQRYTEGWNDCLLQVKSMVSKAPSADVVPVVYGRWGTGRFNLETGNYEEQCTRCRNFSKEYGKPYCPNCGAKMDENWKQTT